jgi:hypothetical protein
VEVNVRTVNPPLELLAGEQPGFGVADVAVDAVPIPSEFIARI